MTELLCRLCANPCTGSRYKNLYDDFEVYNLTTKYFDPMFLNANYEIGAICFKCWYSMVDFHKLQENSNRIRTQQMKKDDQFEFYKQTICPICDCDLKENGKMSNLSYGDLAHKKVLIKYFKTEASNDDLNIKSICLKCWSRIFKFQKFQDDVLGAQSKFIKDEVRSDAATSDVTIYNIPIKTENYNHITLKNTLVINEPEKTYLHEYNSNSKYKESDEYAQNITMNHNFVIKEEPELQLFDVHDEDQSESNYVDNNINDSSIDDDDYDEHDPLKKTDERRKTIPELDAIIAKWRPTLECLVCGVVRPTFSLLQKHFSDKHPNIKCHIICCQCKLQSHYYIEEHLRYHEDPNSFKCKICGHTNITRLRLKRHMDYWHSEKNNKKINMTEDQSKLLCKECGKNAKTLGALRKHMHRHEAKRKFKCTICDRGFRGRTDLRTHLASHANNTCFICSLQFKNITKLRAHQANEHGNLSERNVIKIENELM
uniref:C2H2-type domain-containing protein n=1 Tax=Musca domestica TaxID=7370 RepID=A0A1I8NL25_MUSDO